MVKRYGFVIQTGLTKGKKIQAKIQVKPGIKRVKKGWKKSDFERKRRKVKQKYLCTTCGKTFTAKDYYMFDELCPHCLIGGAKKLKIKRITNYDLDKDGVPNHKDCNPYDPTKQDFAGSYEKPRTYRGYNVEDYYYSGDKYHLYPGAEEVEKKSFISRLFK